MILAKSDKFINLMTKPTIVYMAVNIVNGKKYIGITAQTLEKRRQCHIKGWGGHDKPSLLHLAIKKYGKESLVFSVLKNCDSYQQALDMERMLIAKWKPEYNQTKGGEGVLGFKMPDDVLKKRGQRPSPLRGRKRPPDVIEKMRRANTGRKLNLSPDAIRIRQEQALHMRELRKASGYCASEKQRRSAGLMGIAKRKRVMCINDGNIFESAKSADEFYGLCKGTVSGYINRVCDKGMPYRRKIFFRYVEHGK